MGLTIGYYSEIPPEILDLLTQTSRLLGGTLVHIASLDEYTTDILLWYFTRSTYLSLRAEIHQHYNIYLIRTRWTEIPRVHSSSVHPSTFYEEYIVAPFDPEEFALRIVAGSYRRGHRLNYDFDPLFYQGNQVFLDKYTS